LDHHRVATLVAQSPPRGLRLLDDTGLPKQGRSAVGGARQYSGTLGKIANCQVVVSAPDVADEPTSSAPVHWPLTARLSLPEGWATARDRRATVHVPAEVALQTKPALALTLVDQGHDSRNANCGEGARTKPALALTLVDQERAWGVSFAGPVETRASVASSAPLAITASPRARRGAARRALHPGRTR
jgi:SRSO17 transposase